MAGGGARLAARRPPSRKRRAKSRLKNRGCRQRPRIRMTAATAVTRAMTDNDKRAAAIRWIQDQMSNYGLTVEELEAAGCFEPPPPPAGCYRNAEGLTWNGQGEMPSWLKRAVNAGQSVEFFRTR